MNGEIAKPARIQVEHDPEVPGSEFSAMNGAPVSENDLLNAPPRESGGTSPTNSNGPEADSLPLETMKQLLSTQLDYYFSR